MRHKVVHDYLGVDEDIVWQVVTRDLPTLVRALEPIVPPTPPVTNGQWEAVVLQDVMRSRHPLFQRRQRGYQATGYTQSTEWLARRVDATAVVVEYDEAR